ncbi:MAG: hypothetical protein ABR535_10590 [Pyrinomonadaceae bacterium]
MTSVNTIPKIERPPRRLGFKVDDYYKMIDLGMIGLWEIGNY